MLESLMVVENFPLTPLIKLRPLINSNFFKIPLTKRSFVLSHIKLTATRVIILKTVGASWNVPSPSPTLHFQNIKRLKI